MTSIRKPPLGLTARCCVENVVDGDTLDIELRINCRVRLLDCWAPETRTHDHAEKKLGLAAKDNLLDLTRAGNGVVFIPTGQAHSVGDLLTLDRILGRVWIDGQDFDLSTQQVAAGKASTTKGGRLGQ